MATLVFVLTVLCLPLAHLADPEGCTIELHCAECVPEYMPLVTSHAAGDDGVVRAARGDELALACGGGRFLAYPQRGALTAVCEGGRYRVAGDAGLRHLLDLGCQESVFEDVLHQIENCAPPLQGRAYQVHESGSRVRHLAALCFDEDSGVAAHLLASTRPLRLPAHAHAAAPLSLLGNFNHMFDVSARRAAERLYADEAAIDRRLRERFKHERFAFAAQTLTAARLLAPAYFEGASRPAADFVSNKAAVWRSVGEGNLRHLQRDVAALLRRERGRGARLDVYAGTHGVLALNTGAGVPRPELFLREGGRLPVPRYLWTAVLAPDSARGAALVLLNDPFVTVSDIRASVFCESTCGTLTWLQELTRHRNYERPLLGLVFCCELRTFAAVVPEMPRVFNDTFTILN